MEMYADPAYPWTTGSPWRPTPFTVGSKGNPMFKRTILTAATLLAAGPALAGGFAQPIATPTVAPPPVAPIVAPSADWSGAYVGGQLGFGRLTLEDTSGADLEDDVNSDVLFGLHAGYMFDFGRLVLGAELDYDWTSIESDYYDIDEEPLQLDSVARAKLRLGYDVGRVLPYVTAGVARASFSSDDPDTGPFLEDSYDGRFAGLGVSYAATDNLVVGIEVLRSDFEDAPFVDSDDSQIDSVTLRGSLRF